MVKDVIGYICWKYVLEERTPPLPSENLEGYNLYLADSDGSIDWELRPIEKLEPLSKFGFSDYALVNLNHEGAGNFTGTLDVKVTLPDGTYTIINVNSRDITAKGLVDKVLARHKLRQRSGVDYNFYLEAKVSLILFIVKLCIFVTKLNHFFLKKIFRAHLENPWILCNLYMYVHIFPKVDI